jgi:NitT/TauT family transport system ATP-binding protein
MTLRASALSHHFDAQPVLNDLSLSVAAGEIVAIVGPSGCGKTTLLRLCAGLLHPSSGLVERGSSDVGFVFQEPALLPWRRVDGNARLLAGSRRELVDELLTSSGLDEHRRKWPYQLSGGMKMRLALVRTLAARPELVLMDEPFGALDDITRRHMHDEFLRLHAERRFAALLVTHSIDEAVYLADRVMVLSHAPARITHEFANSLARPRPPDIRFSAEFSALCRAVSNALEPGQ